jgi:hypothetical protein
MKTWFKIGCYSAATAFVLDVYLHQLGFALLMAAAFYVNYHFLTLEEK